MCFEEQEGRKGVHGDREGRCSRVVMNSPGMPELGPQEEGRIHAGGWGNCSQAEGTAWDAGESHRPVWLEYRKQLFQKTIPQAKRSHLFSFLPEGLSSGCSNKMPQTGGGPEPTDVYFLQFWGLRVREQGAASPLMHDFGWHMTSLRLTSGGTLIPHATTFTTSQVSHALFS